MEKSRRLRHVYLAEFKVRVDEIGCVHLFDSKSPYIYLGLNEGMPWSTFDTHFKEKFGFDVEDGQNVWLVSTNNEKKLFQEKAFVIEYIFATKKEALKKISEILDKEN